MSRVKKFDEFLNEGEISFISKKEGTRVTNPFYDTTGRFYEDKPHAEYAADMKGTTMESFINNSEKLFELVTKYKEVYERWKQMGPDENNTPDAYVLKRTKKELSELKSAIDALIKLA